MIASRTRSRNISLVVIGTLVAGVLIAFYLTRGVSSDQAAVGSRMQSVTANLIDGSLLDTAHRLALNSTTADEQNFAHQALTLTDHELDQAFQTAIRTALTQTAPLKGPLKTLAERISRLKTHLAQEQKQIDDLTKQAASDDSVSDRLQMTQAQMALDQDELSDAQSDLARQGGDQHDALQRALQQYQTTQRNEQLPKLGGLPQPGTLWDRIQLAEYLKGRRDQVLQAAAEAEQHSEQMNREHSSLHNRMTSSIGPTAGPGNQDSSGESMSAAVTRLHNLSNQTKTLSELDKRIQDSQQLAGVYRQWADDLRVHDRGAWHLVFTSLLQILAIVLAVFLIDGLLRRRFNREGDGRRLEQFQSMAKIAARIFGAVFILAIIFGLPSQTSTLIGLATAGLTVVLKDFIVGFFGWFVLIGHNGLHVGDWVEIQGVGGEVIDIGLLRTVLLEVGNWTGTGHPTGRRVSFVNSFAIEGHYFNFSTTGQWLWDEIQVSLASAEDPYQMAELIGKRIEAETEGDAMLAAQEWERVTHKYGLRPFSAKPAVDLRPSATGIDMVVRYITRAPQRYEVKARLFQAIVALLHKQAPTANPQMA